MAERAAERLAMHVAMAQALASEETAAAIAAAARDLAARFDGGGTLLIFGNGGSAADAQHLAAEFTGRYMIDRAPLPALALADNTAAVTAIGNGDGAAIALSTSGTSENVLEGLRAARELGLLTIGVTGDGGAERMRPLCDHLLTIPAVPTPQIQEGTMLVLHTICELVEHSLFGE